MKSVIYTATFPDGTQYVGSTSHLPSRVGHHRRSFRKGRGINARMTAKFKEFGYPAFTACACALPGVAIHELEADVIASLNPALNVILRPHPVNQAGGRPVAGFQSLADAARAKGIPYARVLGRINAGWTDNQALEIDQPPPRPEVKKREITVDGVTMTLNQWADHAGTTPAVIHSRLGAGWTERQAVGVDPRPGADKSERAAARRETAEAERRNRRIRYGDFEGSRKEAAQRFGIAYATLSARLKQGWSVERALTAPVGYAESQRERRERLGLPPLRFS